MTKDKVMSHDIPWRPWECVRAGIFRIYNKNCFCIVDYHSKFPVMKWMEGFSTDNLIKACKIIFSECRLPSKIVSDAGPNSYF